MDTVALLLGESAYDQLTAGTMPLGEPGEVTHQGTVAVMRVKGALDVGGLFGGGGTSYDAIKADAHRLMTDPEVAAVVVEGNSPGGDAAGNDDAAEAIAALSAVKPVVWYNQGMTGSAAYRLAVDADAIVSAPGTRVGSIGAMAMAVSSEGLDEKMGFKRKTYFSEISPKKTATPFNDEGEDAKTKARVNRMGLRFAQAVADRRGVSLEHVKTHFGQGAMIDDEEALEAGAIDHIGLMSDAVALAMKLAADRRLNASPAQHTHLDAHASGGAAHYDNGAPVARQRMESTMLIERLAASGLEKGMSAVRDADLVQLEQRLEAAEATHKALTTQRDALKATADANAQKAEKLNVELTTLKASVEAKEQAAAEAARVTARDALIEGAITDGRVGPGDTNMRAKLVAYGDALGNDDLKGFIDAMPKLHAAGEPPQGHGGNPEPEGDLSTKAGVVAQIERLAASDFKGDFNAAYTAFAKNPANAEAMRLWEE